MKDVRFVVHGKSLPLQANSRSFDSGGQKQPASAQDDNSKSEGTLQFEN